MSEEETGEPAPGIMGRMLRTVLLAIVWLLPAALAFAITYESLLLTMFGGYREPPFIWQLFRDFGLVVLPFMLVLGWLPGAVQVLRGKDWRKATFISLSACLVALLAVVFVVFFGPGVFGWHW